MVREKEPEGRWARRSPVRSAMRHAGSPDPPGAGGEAGPH